MLDTIIGIPRNSYVYSIHIHKYEHEIIQPWLPVSQKYK